MVRWPDHLDLEEVVHNAEPIEAGVIGRLSDGGQVVPQPGGAAGPGEIADVQTELHARSSGCQQSGGQGPDLEPIEVEAPVQLAQPPRRPPVPLTEQGHQ